MKKCYQLKRQVAHPSKRVFSSSSTQQSVHPTLGILARFQAFFYALAFSQSDGVPPPDPARVTQTVGQMLAVNLLRGFQNWLVFQIGSESSKSSFGLQASFGFAKVCLFCGGSFPNLSFSKFGVSLFLASFFFGCVRFSKLASWLQQSFGRQSFLLGKVSFCGNRRFRQSQLVEIGFKFFSPSFGTVGSGFFARFFSLAKSLGLQSHFFGRCLGISNFGVFNFGSHGFSQVSIAKNKVVCKS